MTGYMLPIRPPTLDKVCTYKHICTDVHIDSISDPSVVARFVPGPGSQD